ncbi:MAG TPA: SRPBCC family protein [Candidatus Cybelea sp.]|nr:SRPBCC family protein [Candidatus Cybelea sp.]
MADLRCSIDIAVPPGELFAFFIPQRMPLWYGFEMRARFQAERVASEFSVGQKVRITGWLGGREVGLETTVTQCEWGRRFEWQIEDSCGVRGEQRWEFAPLPGGTRLTMSDSYRMPSFCARVVDVAVTRFAVAARNRSWLGRLKRLASTAGC